MKTIKLKCEKCGAKLEVNSDLDKIQCNYCGNEILIDDEATTVKRVEDAKLKARKNNHEQDLKERQDNLEQQINEKKILEKANAKENFKKSKFSKVLLVFFALAVMLLFTIDGFFAKVFLIIQAGLFMSSWLVGMEIIKEPFNGAKTILSIAGFVLIVPIVMLNGGSSSVKYEKIVWDDIELHNLLPTPSFKKGVIYSNEKDRLSLYYVKVDNSEYKSYVKECKDMGYDIDVDESSSNYRAYNKDGYKVDLSYLRDELHIGLDSPEEMKEFEWPTVGLGSKVPKTKSNIGRISYDNDSSFIIHVANTTVDEFNEYVNLCEDGGFVENRSKSEKYYSASNKDNIKISLRYIGFNTIEISVSTTKNNNDESSDSDVNDNNSNTTNDNKTSNDNKATNKGLRSDFKKAMDSYESFMDDYISFMKKYSKSNQSDTKLLKDYANFLSKYDKVTKDFDKWENEDLNDEELAYYIKVQTRVNKKLAEI